MASITSAISLLVVLLATYSSAVPINVQYTTSSPDFKFTTGQTIVDHENTFNMHLLTDDESTGVPTIHSPRSDAESDSNEHTTIGQDEVSHSPRSAKDFSFTTAPGKVFVPVHSSEHDQHTSGDLFFTTVESKTQFNQRALNDARYGSEVESSTSAESSYSTPSSVKSFGQMAEILRDNQSEERFTTAESEILERSTEEPKIFHTRQFPGGSNSMGLGGVGNQPNGPQQMNPMNQMQGQGPQQMQGAGSPQMNPTNQMQDQGQQQMQGQGFNGQNF